MTTSIISKVFSVISTTAFLALIPIYSFGQTSIWNPAATPAIASNADPQAVELGVKFKSDIDGTITGIRFFKGPQNTGTHTVSLWTTGGALLARTVSSGETASGWQQVSF